MPEYRFCPVCGAALETYGRSFPRQRCTRCGYRLFRNPIVGVAAVVMNKGHVLMGRRAQGRSKGGLWCLPCGYVEWGEDIRDAAKRELMEETGLEVRLGEVFEVHSNFHDPESLTVGVWFRAEITGGTLRAGDDLEEVGFFHLDATPEPLAFPTDRLVLEKLRSLRA